jgi:hypothetical protein
VRPLESFKRSRFGLLAIASFIIRYRDEGATPGEYETAASEHVGDSRKRLVVTLVNASRLEPSRLTADATREVVERWLLDGLM